VLCSGTPSGNTIQGPWTKAQRRRLLGLIVDIESQSGVPRALGMGALVLEVWLHLAVVLFRLRGEDVRTGKHPVL
jgi:hypothetical protein